MQRLTSAKARAEKGVSSAGFTTTVQPAARAAPTFRVIMSFKWAVILIGFSLKVLTYLLWVVIPVAVQFSQSYPYF